LLRFLVVFIRFPALSDLICSPDPLRSYPNSM
jgi:hypothetical protein